MIASEIGNWRSCNEIGNAYYADAVEIFDYIKDSYIGRYRRISPRRPPLFATEMWNIIYWTHQETAQAYNDIEGCFFLISIFVRGVASYVLQVYQYFKKGAINRVQTLTPIILSFFFTELKPHKVVAYI